MFPESPIDTAKHMKDQGRGFWQGSAHEKAPTAADVLACLLSDSVSYENARSFEEWASDLGADVDSRAAKRTYEKRGRLAKKVRALLGDAFGRCASAEH